jgi:hypothetical protein
MLTRSVRSSLRKRSGRARRIDPGVHAVAEFLTITEVASRRAFLVHTSALETNLPEIERDPELAARASGRLGSPSWLAPCRPTESNAMMKRFGLCGALMTLAACQEPGSGQANPPAVPAAGAPAPAATTVPSTSPNAVPATAPSVEPKPVASPATPDAIKVPEGQGPLLKVRAKGVQIYVCAPKKDAPQQLEWTLKGPEAELFDQTGKLVGKHFAGPTWEATDGSKVIGAVKAKAEAPTSTAVPWLLLEAKANEGHGILSHVIFIQRVDTEAGKAPAQGCDKAHAQAETRVDYTANYYFYAASAKGPETH